MHKAEYSQLHQPNVSSFVGVLYAFKNYLLGGGSVDQRLHQDGFTELHLAIYRQDLDEVKSLLARGADPAVVNIHNKNALHFAAERGYDEILLCLLQHWPSGTSVDIFSVGKLTPLDLAIINKHLNAAISLLTYGAKLDEKYQRDFDALALAQRYLPNDIEELMRVRLSESTAAQGESPSRLLQRK